ncbi:MULTISPECIES: SMI1/KNR4 family protein [Corallococcus]|uniref:SMI1/KNR4 family protein n=1 Tax=Corallococcus TaxID=83461 RepID=UPI00117C42C7|nr:SMI1/KNR4 family protein [Corallococcus silvisoli]TSC34536.1 SMI1/KNR4 family protein [Corallococcus sp. Z5C101001]
MTELLNVVAAQHYPHPPATAAAVEAFEHRMGWRLDPDLRAFYSRFDGAKLFRGSNAPYQILPLAEVRRARVVMSQADTDAAGPASWYAVCQLQDSNYVLLDVGQQFDGRYPLRDGYREGFPDPYYCPVIAHSFAEFLAGALAAAGRSYWLKSIEEEGQ